MGCWGVNQHLKLLRDEWMKRMLDRENRIMDTALVGHTIHSVTFFASTSMLILAGLVGMLGAVDTAHGMLSQFSFATPVSREFFELKILLLFGDLHLRLHEVHLGDPAVQLLLRHDGQRADAAARPG